ncbi:12394_t:CDS:2 [Rhizophagus irregularis]|nr:12394_t:CDS:2 [Rhizophagus irregularis]
MRGGKYLTGHARHPRGSLEGGGDTYYGRGEGQPSSGKASLSIKAAPALKRSTLWYMS